MIISSNAWPSGGLSSSSPMSTLVSLWGLERHSAAAAAEVCALPCWGGLPPLDQPSVLVQTPVTRRSSARQGTEKGRMVMPRTGDQRDLDPDARRPQLRSQRPNRRLPQGPRDSSSTRASHPGNRLTLAARAGDTERWASNDRRFMHETT